MTLLRIQPIAPTWRKEPVDDLDWLFDLNYDGFRGLTYIDPGRNRLISRNRHTFDRFDGLTDRLASLLGAFFFAIWRRWSTMWGLGRALSV